MNAVVDVLIIGAGASGAAVAWSLAETRMRILCLEQGDWVKPTDYPANGRDWEARIYATPPRDVWRHVGALTVPTLALRGPRSDTLTPASWARWRALQPDATFVELPGTGHLLPLERPAAVAAEVHAFLARRAGPTAGAAP